MGTYPCTSQRDQAGSPSRVATGLLGPASFLVGGFPLDEFFLGDLQHAVHRGLEPLGGLGAVLIFSVRVRGHGAPWPQCSRLRPGREWPDPKFVLAANDDGGPGLARESTSPTRFPHW